MTKQEYEKDPRLYWENPMGIGLPIDLESGSPVPLEQNLLWVKNIQQDIIINSGRDLCVDLGCGGGRYLGNTAPYFKKVIGVDFSINNIDKAKRHIESAGIKNVGFYLTSLADMWEIQDDSVDFAYSVAVLMHMTNETRISAMKEIHRILKPDGRAVLLEITSMEHGAFDCPNLTPLEWENMLIEAGLVLDEKTGKEIEGDFVRYKLHKGGI
jgi:cyclopropane fatty-acyl-phospholipid synthase-like methyltransferase